MSYIRSGSNPEHLYIWGEINNKTTISNAQNECFTVPTKDWERLIAKWGREHFYAEEKKGIKIGTLLLREEWTHGEPIIDKKLNPKLGKTECKWILYFKGKKVCEMWTTTMWYISFSNMEHWQPKAKKSEVW